MFSTLRATLPLMENLKEADLPPLNLETLSKCDE